MIAFVTISLVNMEVESYKFSIIIRILLGYGVGSIIYMGVVDFIFYVVTITKKLSQQYIVYSYLN